MKPVLEISNLRFYDILTSLTRCLKCSYSLIVILYVLCKIMVTACVSNRLVSLMHLHGFISFFFFWLLLVFLLCCLGVHSVECHTRPLVNNMTNSVSEVSL